MTYLVFLLLISYVSCDHIIQSNTGPIRGISLDTKNVDAYFGIPYAEPPVGNLRFAKPVPKSPWAEIFVAKELPPACIQSLMELTVKFMNESSLRMDEDCLYLNLWVPKTDTTLRPIMIFIHGGGFMTGTASLRIYDGANLAQHGDVIVASINYRVGSLGFFSAFIDEAAGSMGMYDQVLAIQWIKDNAKAFGGDPDNIVIFGESAGGWSVSLHMASPLSRSLFKRGIVQSGASVHPMFSNNDVLRMGSQTISKLLGCSSDDVEFKENPKSVVECMKNLPVEKFPAAEEGLVKNFAMLVPRVGDEFLPLSPTDLFRKGEFKDTEVLLGVTRDEGSMFVALQLGFESGDMLGEKIDPDSFNKTIAEKMTQGLKKNEHFDKIVQKYLHRAKEQNRYTYLDAVSDIMGDALVACPTVFHADFQSLKNHPVYFYVFDYRSPTSQFPEWLGVPHFQEVPYVLGNPLMGTFSKIEEKLSKDVMDMWTAFAKTGNPNIPGALKWPKYTYEDPKYLAISTRDKVGVRPDNYRCEAWRDVYQATIDEEVIENFKLSSDCTRIISLLCNTHHCKGM